MALLAPTFLCEDRLLTRFMGLSVMLHVIVVVVDWSFMISSSPSRPQELEVIEAELAEALPVAVEFNKLPPPPTHAFTLEDSSAVEQAEVALPRKTAEVAMGKEDVKGDPNASVDVQASVPQPDVAAEEYKQQLFERLQQEQTRKETQKRRINARKKKQEAARQAKIAGLLQRSQDQVQANATGVSKAATAYIFSLKAIIQKHYEIPDLYRQQNQKFVEIKLLLGHDGRIREIDLVRGSGKSALDEIILNSVEQSQPFPAPPRELRGQPFILRFQP
ncbi:MAG: TonB C-terminal domain-containing protein [Zetaproteobacteria bacterium]|nr:TonB C-terminal domain-containing protein [Zetaproteobacteria bacterium]